ncbi:hypothetical protein ACTXT7_001536 [Hymenolepis weldensis]
MTDSAVAGHSNLFDYDSGAESSVAAGVFSVSAFQVSNQVEQGYAFTWIKSHLEEDPTTCLRKDEVYEDYKSVSSFLFDNLSINYCEQQRMKPLNTADFGKVMKRAFPNVRPRRLGQRGQSRYCYGGMRKKRDTQAPLLPDLTLELSNSSNNNDAYRSGPPSATSTDDQEVRAALGVEGSTIIDAIRIVIEYAQTVVGGEFSSLLQLALHLIRNRFVNSHSTHALSLISYNQQQQRTNPTSSAIGNQTSQSLSNLITPHLASTFALREAIEKSLYKSNGAAIATTAGDNPSSSCGKKSSSSAQSSPLVLNKPPVVKKEATDSNLDINSPAGRSGSIGSLGGSSSVPSQPSPTITAQPPSNVPSYHHSPAQAAGNIQVSLPTGGYQQQSVQYPFPFPPFTPAARTGIYPTTPSYSHQQIYGSSERRASFAEGTSSYASAYGLSVPPATPSHYGNRSLNSSYAPPVVPPAAAAATSAFNSSNPVDASQSFGHGSTSASSIAHQHPAQQLTRIEPSAPAPQQPPPGTGRSPYAYQVPTKPQTAADVPGAVEPIVRTHLGGLSPNKDYYVSGNPASSSTTSTSTAFQRESGADYYSDFTAMSPAVVIPPGSGNEGTSWSVPHANTTSSPTCRVQHQQPSANDDFAFDRLPHVGASPCPHNDSSDIPSRSSANFLDFLSPSSRQDGRTTTAEENDLDRTLTNLSPPEASSLTKPEPPPQSSASSKQPLHVYISEEEQLAAQREALHDALSTPTGETDGYDQGHSSSGTASSNAGSSKGIKVGPSSAGSNQGRGGLWLDLSHVQTWLICLQVSN